MEIVRGVLLGLQALHAQRVVHWDIKPENVLLGERGEVTDFGLSRDLDEQGSNITTGSIGTFRYRAGRFGRKTIDGAAILVHCRPAAVRNAERARPFTPTRRSA